MKVLYHLDVTLALCFITFTILDWFNPMMNFVENTISSRLLFVFCVISAAIAIRHLYLLRRHGRSGR